MKQPHLLPLLTSLALALVPAGASASQMGWTDIFVGSSPSWQHPTEDLTAIAPGGPTPYSALSIFVDKSGIYEITSNQSNFDDPWDGMLFVYAESFDPAKPLENVIAANDNGPEPNSSKISVLLTAGVVYRVVTTPKTAVGGNLNFGNRIVGPGNPQTSACFLDEPERNDSASDIALLGGRFCVQATWQDSQGNSGVAFPSSHRTDSSGQLWFFSPDNWELSFKVLDGCGVNGHYWFMLAGTTNVGFEVHVRDMWGLSSVAEKVYTNPPGRRARTVLDTSALDGCVAN